MKQESKTSKSALALALLALLLWCACTLLAQRAGAHTGTSVRWTGEGAGVAPSQVERAGRYAREDRGGNIPSVTLWRENADQSVQAPGGAHSAAHVTEVYGSAEQLYPVGFLAGSWPVRGDGTGCAVGQNTAEQLWGSSGAVGMELVWKGKTYTVRGVFQGERDLVVVQGADDTAYPGMLLSFPDGGGRETAQAYLNSNEMGGGSLLDLDFLGWSLQTLSALPALLLAAGLLIRLLRRGWMLRAAPLLLAQYLPPALVGGGLVLWAAGFPWALPDRLIPTKWSDFDFWPRLAGEFGETVGALLTRTPAQWDLALWGPALACLALVLPACGLTVLCAERARAPTGRALMAGSLISMGALFALALLLAPAGGVSPTRGMWTLPLLWLAGDYGLHCHTRCLRPKEGGITDDPQTRQTKAIPPAGHAGSGA